MRDLQAMSDRTREFLARQDALDCPSEPQITPETAPVVIAALRLAEYWLEMHAVSGSILDFDMRLVMHIQIQRAENVLAGGDDHGQH